MVFNCFYIRNLWILIQKCSTRQKWRQITANAKNHGRRNIFTVTVYVNAIDFAHIYYIILYFTVHIVTGCDSRIIWGLCVWGEQGKEMVEEVQHGVVDGRKFFGWRLCGQWHGRGEAPRWPAGLRHWPLAHSETYTIHQGRFTSNLSTTPHRPRIATQHVTLYSAPRGCDTLLSKKVRFSYLLQQNIQKSQICIYIQKWTCCCSK